MPGQPVERARSGKNAFGSPHPLPRMEALTAKPGSVPSGGLVEKQNSAQGRHRQIVFAGNPLFPGRGECQTFTHSLPGKPQKKTLYPVTVLGAAADEGDGQPLQRGMERYPASRQCANHTGEKGEGGVSSRNFLVRYVVDEVPRGRNGERITPPPAFPGVSGNQSPSSSY